MVLVGGDGRGLSLHRRLALGHPRLLLRTIVVYLVLCLRLTEAWAQPLGGP